MAVKFKASMVQTMCLLALLGFSVFAVVAFRTQVIDLSYFKSPPSYDKELLKNISMNGRVKAKDLNLSGREIKQINFAALRCKDIFPKVGLTVNMPDQYSPVDVLEKTKLILGLGLHAEDSEVIYYDRTMQRDELVPFVVRSLERAVEEFLHIRDIPDRSAPIKRLYL